MLGQLVLVKVRELCHHGPPEGGRQRPGGGRFQPGRRVEPVRAGAEGLHQVRHGHPVGGQAHGGGEVALQVRAAGRVRGRQRQQQVGGGPQVQVVAAVKGKLEKEKKEKGKVV